MLYQRPLKYFHRTSKTLYAKSAKIKHCQKGGETHLKVFTALFSSAFSKIFLALNGTSERVVRRLQLVQSIKSKNLTYHEGTVILAKKQIKMKSLTFSSMHNIHWHVVWIWTLYLCRTSKDMDNIIFPHIMMPCDQRMTSCDS